MDSCPGFLMNRLQPLAEASRAQVEYDAWKLRWNSSSHIQGFRTRGAATFTGRETRVHRGDGLHDIATT